MGRLNGKLAVWAGEGTLAARVAGNALKERPVLIVGFKEFSDIPLLRSTGAEICVISIGQMGKNLGLLRKEGVSELVMIGKFPKERIFGRTGIDLKGLAMIMKLANSRDMSIFRVLEAELRKIGISVVSQARYLPEFMSSKGVMTLRRPAPAETRDIRYAADIARKVAELDIGQTLVARHGTIVAVEAFEGTNAAIDRVPARLARQCVVVKASRITQDFRFDIPSIGLQTLEIMRKKGIRAIGLEAGRTLMVDRPGLIAFANRNRISMIGF